MGEKKLISCLEILNSIFVVARSLVCVHTRVRRMLRQKKESRKKQLKKIGANYSFVKVCNIHAKYFYLIYFKFL